MPFSIGARKLADAVAFSCVTASDAVDKVLELKQQRYKHVVVRDDSGRTINLDELSSLCEAGED